jgi:ethanolamine ammonia-lyase large subunit
MAKKKGNGLFAEASRLRDKHPKKFKDWKDYVSWASELRGGKSKAKKAAPGKKKKKAGKVAGPATAVKPARSMGTISYHLGQAKKQLEEQLAWLLLDIRHEHRITYRRKLQNKARDLDRKIKAIK